VRELNETAAFLFNAATGDSLTTPYEIINEKKPPEMAVLKCSQGCCGTFLLRADTGLQVLKQYVGALRETHSRVATDLMRIGTVQGGKVARPYAT